MENQNLAPKIGNFGIVRLFDIPHYSQFCQFSYFPFKSIFSISISYFSEFGRSTFERSLIFKFETSAILKFYCLKFQPSSLKLIFNILMDHLNQIFLFLFSQSDRVILPLNHLINLSKHDYSYIVTQSIISIMSSERLRKKLISGFPLSPIFPIEIPKSKLHITRPKIFVPFVYCEDISHS